MKVQLRKLAHARSGDKGDTVNIGLIAYNKDCYDLLEKHVEAEDVKKYFTRSREGFSPICKGEVERFELPNIHALNFLLHESLGGGGTASLRTDPQGKTLSTALLRMEIEIDDQKAKQLGFA